MNILLTNDDGIQSEGIKALQAAMPKGTNVVVVAPVSERSASSHSISLGQKLRIEDLSHGDVRAYAVHGTPADCVKFALCGIPHFKPDVVFSGINHGANTGVSVYYSGTISGAREGFINRVPAAAISLCSPTFQDFTASMEIARRLAESYRQGILPLNVMLNVNVPALPRQKIKGVKIVKQAASRFVEEFVLEEEKDGKKIYTLAGEIEIFDSDGQSDEEAVSNGFIAMTPLKLDMTDYGAMEALRGKF